MSDELGDDELPTDGYDVYKNYMAMQNREENKYSHRNGESEPPEVEGWYWIMSGDAWQWSHVAYLDMADDGELEWYDPGYYPELKDALYYGPIPQPRTEA